MTKRRLRGIVTKLSGDQTATVTITTSHVHPLYGKRYQREKKIAAHNPGNIYQVGEEVIIEEHRPISRRKHWLIREKIGK